MFPFYFGFLSSSYALEVVSFKVDIFFFKVTVAFDDLDSKAIVSCIIYADEKPIAKGSKYINGVDTLLITNDPDITRGLTVKCKKN